MIVAREMDNPVVEKVSKPQTHDWPAWQLKSPNFNQKTFLNMNIHSIYNFHTAISDILGNLYPELSIYAKPCTYIGNSLF
jgi:hypothetical protein